MDLFQTKVLDAATAKMALHWGSFDFAGSRARTGICYTSITEEAVHILRDYKGFLPSNGLESLSYPAAVALSKREGDLLLDGLREVSDEILVVLSGHSGCLSLNGLTDLCDGQAVILSRHRGELQLNGLESLSEVAATALCQHRGTISLLGLTSLTLEAYKPLAKCSRKIRLSNKLEDDLNIRIGIERFIQNPDSFDLSLISNLSEEAAHMLVLHRGELCLSGLISISESALFILSSHDGGIILDGICNLSEGLAAELARYSGNISLNGLTELTDLAAKELAKHQGQISLRSLTKNSDKALRKIPKKWLTKSDLDRIARAKILDLTTLQSGRCDFSQFNSISDEAAAFLYEQHDKIPKKILNKLPEKWLNDRLRNRKKKLKDKVIERRAKAKMLDLATLQVGRTDFSRFKSISDEAAAFLYEQHDKIPEEILYSLPDKWLNDRLRNRKEELDIIYDAECFINGDDSVNISEWKSLPEPAAEMLADYSGHLFLNGVSELSILAAEHLGQREGFSLFLGGLQNISKPVASALSKHRGPLVLSGIADIQESVAKSLGNHKGLLNLNGLKELSAAAAHALAHHEGELRLCGLEDVSKAVAQALARHKGPVYLDGVKALHEDAALALAESQGVISLKGLSNLSSQAMDVLARDTGKFFLDPLSATAKMLKKHRAKCFKAQSKILDSDKARILIANPQDLKIESLTSITDEAANILAASGSRNILNISGIKSISIYALKSLSKHKGDLVLDGLTDLCPESAFMLSHHRGNLSLRGLKKISDAVAWRLARHGGHICLDGLTELSLEAARDLSATEGTLSIKGLNDICEGALDALGSMGNRLSTNKELQKQIQQNAEILNSYKAGVFIEAPSSIRLNDFTSITDDAARILSKYHGALHLDGLTSISVQAAKHLSAHQALLSLKGLKKISKSSAKYLSMHQGVIDTENLAEWLEKLSSESTAQN